MSEPAEKTKTVIEVSEEQIAKEGLPWWLRLPPELEGASSDALAERYYELAEQKLAAEMRAGRHPSGMNNPKNIDPDPLIRAVLIAGLRVIVREMGAVHYELNNRPVASLLSYPMARGKTSAQAAKPSRRLNNLDARLDVQTG